LLVARPSKPLISRDQAARHALNVIDRDGLDALSLERLADEIGVRAPSLYHHFRDKAEILAEVARLIVLETPVPRQRAGAEWSEWFVRLAMNFRRTILRHRNAASVLLQFLPRDLLVNLYENAALYLLECGIDPGVHVLILDGLEKLTLGSAMVEALHPRRGRSVFPSVVNGSEPALEQAMAANELTGDRLFEGAVRSFLSGVVAPATTQR
jgi:TetR/AcrR family tetracycline transcriptional repressor